MYMLQPSLLFLLCFSASNQNEVGEESGGLLDCVTSIEETVVECSTLDEESLLLVTRLFPRCFHLSIHLWNSKLLNLTHFFPLRNLQILEIRDSSLRRFLSEGNGLDRLTSLEVGGSRLADWDSVCELLSAFPSLLHLSIRQSRLQSLNQCSLQQNMLLQTVDFSNNEMLSRVSWLPPSVRDANFSSCLLTEWSLSPLLLSRLSLADNPLSSLSFPLPPSSLVFLNISRTKLKEFPVLLAPRLEYLIADETSIQWLDISGWKVESLKEFSLLMSASLTSIWGLLPGSLRVFRLSDSPLPMLPPLFFSACTHSLEQLEIFNASLSCGECGPEWATPAAALARSFLVSVGCAERGDSNCLAASTMEVARSPPGSSLVLPCLASQAAATAEWWRERPFAFLGRFDPVTNSLLTSENGSVHGVEVLVGGSLRFSPLQLQHVERYICVVRRGNSSAAARARVRVSLKEQWYSFDVLASVFWGCLMSGILACAFSFILNITWILCRKSMLWWIQRAERLSRVRKMVEAIEKYRQRQIDSIHDKYQKRVQLIRDNYHQQVEQLRVSYASKAERFSDYRAAQIESVSAHLDSIRHNYQLQLGRAREYGSKRAEQLWESYERQVNRVRMLNLQSRLKIMRQYNIKQHFINKLLENVQQQINSRDPVVVVSPLEVEQPELGVRVALSRSSSFCSLPEYVLAPDGQLRPSALTSLSVASPFQSIPRSSSTTSLPVVPLSES